MKVTVNPVHIVIPPSKQARSAGVHISGVIRCIAMEVGILEQERLEDLMLVEVQPGMRFSDPVVAIRVSMGIAWEEWYIPNVLGPEGVIDHPGEFMADGIYMSPDGEELSEIIVGGKATFQPRIHEVKCTYKSTNTVGETEDELRAQFLWMAQLKSYCHAAKTTLADLHVLFVCGNYKFPIQPQIKRFSIEFDQDEIDMNWELMTDYRNQRLGINAT